LTCLSDELSLKWEPGAALPRERIDTLREAYARGIYTWVSLEPVLYPGESLSLIDATHEFVNQYKLGTLNHHEHAKTIDWRDYGQKAVAAVKRHRREYYIKDDLKRYVNG
jgi:DNA repair photolyase